MFKIPPKKQLIFRLVNQNATASESKLFIIQSLLKDIFFLLFISMILGFALYLSFQTPYSQPILVAYSFILSFLIIGSVIYFIKGYTLSMKLYEFSVANFDKSISAIADDFDTFTSGYMIEYLCIETPIFDHESVNVENFDRPVMYQDLRKNVLGVYNPYKSPNIPFRGKEREDYMRLLKHAFKCSLSQSTFRELYVQNSKLEKA